MNTLTAEEIIRLLEEPTDHFYPIKLRVTKEASSEEFVLAMQQATNPLTRQILCDIAGDRFEQAAVPDLIKFLYDQPFNIHCAAVDALGKIGDLRAGPTLFELLANKGQHKNISSMVASALGAVHYRPAIPLLIQTLNDPDHMLRGLAAWGLGIMPAIEAEGALCLALSRETVPPDTYAHERLTESLEAIELVSRALGSLPRKEGIALLLAALKQKPFVGVRFTSATWALGELGAREARAPLKRLLVRYPKGFLAEAIKASLLGIEEKNP